MNKIIIAFLIIGVLFAATACSVDRTNGVEPNAVKSIAEVKTNDLLGTTVTVKGTVVNTVKIGRISGYKLTDETGSIDVSTVNLPKENTTIKVTGTLMNSSYFGYYIQPNE